MFKTILDVASNPVGTARLVEGACTLNRCDQAKLTVAQMKTIFPSLKQYSDEGVKGFIAIGKALIAGDVRFAPVKIEGGNPAAEGGKQPA